MKTPLLLLPLAMLLALPGAAYSEGTNNVLPRGPAPDSLLPDPDYKVDIVQFNLGMARRWAEDGYWREAITLAGGQRGFPRWLIEFGPDHFDPRWTTVAEGLLAEIDMLEEAFYETTNLVETARRERRERGLERVARAREEIPDPKTPLEVALVTDFAGNVAKGLEGPIVKVWGYAVDPSVQFTNEWANLIRGCESTPVGMADVFAALRRGENTTFPTSSIPKGERYRIKLVRGEGDETTMIRYEDPASTEKNRIYHFVPAVQWIDLFVSSEEMYDAYVVLPEKDENGDPVFFKPGYPTARFPGLGILLHWHFNRLPRVPTPERERRRPPHVCPAF